MRKSISDF